DFHVTGVQTCALPISGHGPDELGRVGDVLEDVAGAHEPAPERAVGGELPGLDGHPGVEVGRPGRVVAGVVAPAPVAAQPAQQRQEVAAAGADLDDVDVPQAVLVD